MPPGAKVIHRHTHACTCGDTHVYAVTPAIVYELPQERFSVDSTPRFSLSIIEKQDRWIDRFIDGRYNWISFNFRENNFGDYVYLFFFRVWIRSISGN